MEEPRRAAQQHPGRAIFGVRIDAGRPLGFLLGSLRKRHCRDYAAGVVMKLNVVFSAEPADREAADAIHRDRQRKASTALRNPRRIIHLINGDKEAQTEWPHLREPGIETQK